MKNFSFIEKMGNLLLVYCRWKKKKWLIISVSESIIYAKVKQSKSCLVTLELMLPYPPVEVFQQCRIFLFQFIFIILQRMYFNRKGKLHSWISMLQDFYLHLSISGSVSTNKIDKRCGLSIPAREESILVYNRKYRQKSILLYNNLFAAWMWKGANFRLAGKVHLYFNVATKTSFVEP